MKKYKKRVRKENLRYFKVFKFLEDLVISEESNNVEKIRKKKQADRNKIMKISQEKSTVGPEEVIRTSAMKNSGRLYRAKGKWQAPSRDQLISRKASRVPAPSVDPGSVNKMKTVGGSSGLYRLPRQAAEESNFDQVVRTITRIETSHPVSSPQTLPAANVLQGRPSKHIESKEEEQNSTNQGRHDPMKELASCSQFKRKILEIMLFRKKILNIIGSDHGNRLGRGEFEQSCLVDNTILYKPIRGGLTLETQREVPEAGFRDGTPVAHQVLTSNTTDLVSKKFLDEHFSIEQDDSHFQDTRGSVPLPLEHAENPLGVEVQNNEGSVPVPAKHAENLSESKEHWIPMPLEHGENQPATVSTSEVAFSMMFDHKTQKFVHRRSRDQPFVLCQVQYFSPGTPFTAKRVKLGRFLADTGAQINCGNYTLLDLMGIKRCDIEEYTWAAPEMKINGVGGNVDAIRGVHVKIHSIKHGTTVPATFYLAEQLGCNILSESLVYELGYLSDRSFKEEFLGRNSDQDDFIQRTGHRLFGSKSIIAASVSTTKPTKGNMNSGEKRHKAEKIKDACANSQEYVEGKLKCKCMKRTEQLPNIGAIDKILESIRQKYEISVNSKNWPAQAQSEVMAKFVQLFRSTAFNTCTTQPLPTMKVKKMNIQLKDGAVRPVNITIPYNVPVAFRKMAYQELKAMERMGIIEAVPAGETSDWCAPMMAVAKKMGGVRLVTNFRALNKWCKRAPHHTTDTLRQVLSIPAVSEEERDNGRRLFFSSLDAWNGYHSIPVEEDSRHYLTFTTEFGRYRYKVAPQGFLGSGDHYTQTTNEIFTRQIDKYKSQNPNLKKIWQCPVVEEDSVPMKRCIDDTLTWAASYEDAARQVWQMLHWGAQSGIIFNPDKVIIGQNSIKAFGFNLDEAGIHPTEEMKAVITGFEEPKTLRDMRAFMGLIAQIGWTLDSKSRNLIFQLRNKLKGRVKVLTWTDDEKEIFKQLKLAAGDAMEVGIERMIRERLSDEESAPLVLTSDWSAQGTGFQLHSVTCKCHKKNKDRFKRFCCGGGWHLIYAGGRFNSPAETKYAPIEGELLGIVVALHKSRYLVQGHENLTVLTDHKPLVGYLDKLVDSETDNRRMFNLRRKTQNYSFTTQHVPGVHIGATDGISRRTPDEEQIPTEEWVSVNKTNFKLDNEVIPEEWLDANKNAIILSRYRDVKPGNEDLADTEERLNWYAMFEKKNSVDDGVWIRSLVEEVENDQKEFFSFDNWPGQLETSGMIQWDILAMQRNIRQKRMESHNIPKEKERMTAPAFTAWAKQVHAEEYNVMLLNPQVNNLTSLSYDRIARATQTDPVLRRLQYLLKRGNHEEVTLALQDAGNPRIGRGLAINYQDLSVYKECIMVQNRIWIPAALEQEVAAILHLGHKGVCNMIRIASTLCYWSGITEDIKAVSTECEYCRKMAPLPPNNDHTPPLEAEYPGEMISIDVGQLPSGRNFLCVADRFSGYIWARDLRGAGESQEIISIIMESLGGLFLGLNVISSDNASNFTSYEFVNWAKRYDIHLDYSAAWNPAGNMHAETNIKKAKRAVSELCGQNRRLTLRNPAVIEKLMAINNTPSRTSDFTPQELLYAIYLGHIGLPISDEEKARATEGRQNLIRRLKEARAIRQNVGDKNDISGDPCTGAANDKESFLRQEHEEDQTECQHDEEKNGGSLTPGEDVWFRVFPSTKKGARWKRGVILGRGNNIIKAGGTRIGDQSDRGRTVVPSHHYTVWDSELQFITSRDRHHIRKAYSNKQRARLLSWIDEILLSYKSGSKLRDNINLDDQNLHKAKYRQWQDLLGKDDEVVINTKPLEELQKQLEEESLNSRLRFESQENNQVPNQPTPEDIPPQTQEDNYQQEQEPLSDPRDEDPEPRPKPNVAIPRPWNDITDEHIVDTENWFDEIDPMVGDFTTKEMTMEPRRLRSEGIGSGWMIPDVKTRGRPYIQKQNFQPDRHLTQDEANMICLRQFNPETIARLLDESQFTTPKLPLNHLTMGVTETEILESLGRTKNPRVVPWHPDGYKEQIQYHQEPDEPILKAPKPKPPQGTKWHRRQVTPTGTAGPTPRWAAHSWANQRVAKCTIDVTLEELAQCLRNSATSPNRPTTPQQQPRPSPKKPRRKSRRNSN